MGTGPTNAQTEGSERRVDETLIERYIRWPETLDAATCRTVERCLLKDAAARAVARFYLYFYQEMDAIEVEPRDLEGFAGQWLSTPRFGPHSVRAGA